MPYVGIDIGATWTRIGIADNNGKIIKKIKRRTITISKEEFIGSIIDEIKLLITELDSSIDAIGIGTIGPINLRRGEIRNPPNIPLKNIPIVNALRKEFKVPVVMVNDCTAAIIGEYFYGAARNTDNAVYITLSSGIGGGAIVDGSVLFGKDGNAVEVGHTVVDYEGKLRCCCGGYGHWEAYTSGVNIGNFVNYLLTTKYSRILSSSILNKYFNNVRITYEILFSNLSDHLVKRLLIDDVATINAVGFSNVINNYDPDVISVGGSIALKNPHEYVLKPMLEKLELFATNRIPKITITPLGDDVVLYGSIAVAIHRDLVPSIFRLHS